MGFLIALVVVWLLCGLIGWSVGDHQGRGGEGFLLGFLLGPFGVVAAAALPPSKDVQYERDSKFAQHVAYRMAPLFTQPVAVATPDTSVREAAVVEALRRHPDLCSATDSDSLAKLATLIEILEREAHVRLEVDSVLAKQAAEVQQGAPLASVGSVMGYVNHVCACGHEFNAVATTTCPTCRAACSHLPFRCTCGNLLMGPPTQMCPACGLARVANAL